VGRFSRAPGLMPITESFDVPEEAWFRFIMKAPNLGCLLGTTTIRPDGSCRVNVSGSAEALRKLAAYLKRFRQPSN